MLVIYWCNNFFPTQIKIMRTLRVYLPKIVRDWDLFLIIQSSGRGNRERQFSTDVTFQTNICRAVQFSTMTFENICSAVQYSFVIHEVHRCKIIKFGLSVKYCPIKFLSTSCQNEKKSSHEEHDCWKSEPAVNDYVTSVLFARTFPAYRQPRDWWHNDPRYNGTEICYLCPRMSMSSSLMS